MTDCISRQAAIDAMEKFWMTISDKHQTLDDAMAVYADCKRIVKCLPSAQPELPPYVAEIEEEYQKAVANEWIHKPLAKALYEAWKKHDREDVSRHG